MPEVQSSDVKLEIGHVLFIDIVGYSKLLITDQSQQLQKLKEIVRETEQFCLAEAEGKLLRLPTGDGGALVFRNNPEAPVLCGVEISKELKKHPDRAIAALQKLLAIPYAGPLATQNVPLIPALFRLDPMFDPLRNDPRFQKLCEEKPK
jgi:hypothetical protein